MRCRRACTSTTSCPRSSASRSSTSSSAGGRCSRSSAGHRPSPPTTPRASRSPIRRRSTPRVRRERRRKSRPRTGRQPRPGPSAPPHGAARADEGDVVDMSAYREFTGKSVEEALRNAREAFGAELDDLDFEILTPGSRGVLGMGAEPARIVAAPRSALGGAAPKREAAASVPLPPPPPREERPRYGDRERSGTGDRDRPRYGDRGRDRGPRRDDRSYGGDAGRGQGYEGRREYPAGAATRATGDRCPVVAGLTPSRCMQALRPGAGA